MSSSRRQAEEATAREAAEAEAKKKPSPFVHGHRRAERANTHVRDTKADATPVIISVLRDTSGQGLDVAGTDLCY